MYIPVTILYSKNQVVLFLKKIKLWSNKLLRYCDVILNREITPNNSNLQDFRKPLLDTGKTPIHLRTFIVVDQFDI